MKLLLVAVAALLAVSTAWAGEKSVKIGVLTDLTSFASRSAGQGSVDATKIAVADFGGTVLGKPIEVMVADMQSKPDLAVEIARRWYERENVDLIVDVPNSAARIGDPRTRHRQQAPVHPDHRRQRRDHRQGLLAVHHPLGGEQHGDFARLRQRADR